MLALRRTDERLAIGKRISPFFPFRDAALASGTTALAA